MQYDVTSVRLSLLSFRKKLLLTTYVEIGTKNRKTSIGDYYYLLDHGVRFFICFDDVIQSFRHVEKEGVDTIDYHRRTYNIDGKSCHVLKLKV